MKTVEASSTLSWEIHDSWTELLAGTRYLLDLVAEQNHKKIQKGHLIRLTLVAAYQMIEVMFFKQLIECTKSKGTSLVKALEFDLNDRISFAKARTKWPEILTGSKLPLGEEPFQSMKKLGDLRNSAIHYTVNTPHKDLGESALYTAIESSKSIYSFFNNETWSASPYSEFAARYQSRSSILSSSKFSSWVR